MMMSFVSSIASAEIRPIMAGFGAESGEDHLVDFARNGLNTQFWCVRIAPQLDLEMDTEGKVITEPMDPEKKQGYIDHAQAAQKRGIDLYLVTGFFEEYVTQLAELGPYTKAFVQGPTRYITPGEKPAPGPLEERYWLGQLLCEAKFAAELSTVVPSVKAFLIDVEMYAGDMMWRWNSSFDDQTFRAVVGRMGEEQLLKQEVQSEHVDREDRYQWLADNGLLDDYFAIAAQRVADIARRFRREIDAINPDFQLGLLPYEANWFYDGWISGLASERTPVLVCSEEEYASGLVSTAFARTARLKKMGVNFRYLPGLLIGNFSPKQLGIQARRCLEATNGYWLFTTYSLWQPEPEKLWGAYQIKAPKEQYWAALAQANNRETPLRADAAYACPGFVLLTDNEHYLEPKAELPLQVTYSIPPDVALYDDLAKNKLFDGAEADAFGTVAWYAHADREVTVTVDLSRTCRLERIRLIAGHILPNFPAVLHGSIEVLSSRDGDMYYPVARETLLEGRGKHTPSMDYDDLGIEARFIRIVLQTGATLKYSVWTISELAVWGTALE